MPQNDHQENPYSPPTSSSVVFDVDEPEESYSQQLRVFVGSMAPYYLRKWAPLLRGTSPNAGFNWAALLLSGFWLPYRKMYKITIIFYVVVFVETLLEDVVFIGVMGRAETPPVLGTTVGLLAAIVCGGYGNRWYLSHARDIISEVNASGIAEDARLETISRRGGTSVAASLGLFVSFVVVQSVIFLAIDFLVFEPQ